MMNKLTNVPNSMEPIMAIANGFWSSEPMSDANNSGTIAMMVVSEVMTIARKRRVPAV